MKRGQAWQSLSSSSEDAAMYSMFGRGQLCVCVETRETVEVGALGATLPEEPRSTDTVTVGSYWRQL